MTASRMNNSVDTQVVGFLDTNVLHYVSLYLKFAASRDLFPLAVDPAATSAAHVPEAQTRIVDEAEKDLRQSLLRGLGVRYAPVSELELIAGRLRGRAIVKAAQEALPDRMWSKFDEGEIRRRLTPTDCLEVAIEAASIVPALGGAGLAVLPVDTSDTSYILDLTRFLARLVYLQPLDAIIYSAALVAQAHEFYTADGYLLRTVNRIGNPQRSPEQQKMSRQIKERVAELMGWDVTEVILPTASRLKSFLPPTEPASDVVQ